MPRGGKRPGAGAPRGNLNALKHGLYSKQFAVIGRLLAADPKTRDTLLNVGERLQARQRSVMQVAAFLLGTTIERARRQARHGLNLPLPADDWDSIKAAAEIFPNRRNADRLLRASALEKERPRRRNNQKPHTAPRIQSDTDTKNH